MAMGQSGEEEAPERRCGVKEPRRSMKVRELMDFHGKTVYVIESTTNYIEHRIGTEFSAVELQKLIDHGVTVTVNK